MELTPAADIRHRIKTALVLWLIPLLLSACTVLRLNDTLPQAILNQDDPKIIRDGAPTFLIMLDALVAADSDDEDNLMLAAQLYSTYASAFVENDSERSRRLANRAMSYARRGLCEHDVTLCASTGTHYDNFKQTLENYTDDDDIEILFDFATTWAGWLQANADDWTAVAQLPKVKTLFQHILSVDETIRGGSGHLYAGVLEAQLPPALGGKPQIAKEHFERADILSNGRNLAVKTLSAEYYARLVFDKTLHDHLLNTVIEANPVAESLTLSNVLSQERARKLLAESTSYFE